MSQKIFDMAELSVENPVLHEYFVSHTVLVDLSPIQSEEEAKLILEIIKYWVKMSHGKGYYFYKAYIYPLSYLITRYNNTGLIPYFTEYYLSKNSCYRRASRASLTYLKKKSRKDKMIHEHIIYLENMPIAPERMGTGKIKTLYCNHINDPDNRSMVEKWILSLLTESNLAVTSISNRLSIITSILNQYDKNCRLWTDDDIRKSFLDILSTPYSNNTKQNRISSIINFFTFMAENKYILYSSAWLIANEMKIKFIRTYKTTAPSEYIVSQLFNALKDADDHIKISFLLLYSTGMRISELQSLKKDCLDIRENGVFIKFYQPKMRKEVSNVIPQNLCKMIQDYITNHPENKKYLFERYNNIIPTLTLRNRLKLFFQRHNIKNEDGTPYNFFPHSLRHLMAVRMHRYKIPYQYIQEQLHHDNPCMTLFYIEHVDNERIKKMSEWINNKGQKITPQQLALTIQKIQVETAILPNGLCIRPETLPSCQHCNTCFGCNYFTTAKQWLPVLKTQQERLKGFIKSAKEKGWDKAVTNSQRTLEQLDTIINSMEVT